MTYIPLSSTNRNHPHTELLGLHWPSSTPIFRRLTSSSLPPVPPNCDASAVMAKVRGMDNRVVQMVDHGAFHDEEDLTPDLQAKENEHRRQSEVRLKTDMDSGATGYEESSDEANSKDASTG